MSEKDKTIIAYKGFSENMQCRGFQFEVGQSYKHDGRIRACSGGFHACTNPFDVWTYYGPHESRFAVVELSGETDIHKGDSKIAAAEIHIKAEVTLPEFIKTAIEYVQGLCKSNIDTDDESRIDSSGDSAQIGSSGYSARIGSSGYSARINSSGDKAVIACAGINTKVKAKTGAAIAIPYEDKNEQVRFATAVVGENDIEPDTWYSLNESGEFVETNK